MKLEQILYRKFVYGLSLNSLSDCTRTFFVKTENKKEIKFLSTTQPQEVINFSQFIFVIISLYHKPVWTELYMESMSGFHRIDYQEQLILG